MHLENANLEQLVRHIASTVTNLPRLTVNVLSRLPLVVLSHYHSLSLLKR